MSLAEIDKLSLREKLQIMEAIWEDLRERADRLEVPREHRELLASRRERVASGQAELRDWDAVKQSLGGK